MLCSGGFAYSNQARVACVQLVFSSFFKIYFIQNNVFTVETFLEGMLGFCKFAVARWKHLRTWRLHHLKHARAGHASVWEHLGEALQSMNWSNPVLRWGHASQPITLLPGIRHTALNQSKRWCFFFFFHPHHTHTHTLTMLSPSLYLLGFILFQILYRQAGTRPFSLPLPPEAETGNYSSVRTRRFVCFFVCFFFAPKLLRLYLWGLSHHAIVRDSFIHKVHNEGGWLAGGCGVGVQGESHNVAALNYLFLHLPSSSLPPPSRNVTTLLPPLIVSSRTRPPRRGGCDCACAAVNDLPHE